MSDSKIISVEFAPLATLLGGLLTLADAELGGTQGLAITIEQATDGGPRFTVLAATGVSVELIPAQVTLSSGPMLTAAANDDVVLAEDLWADLRWPELTLDAMIAHAPHLESQLRQVRGAAAVSCGWLGQTLVLSCTLDRPVDDTTVAVLQRYEQLINAALVITAAGTADGAQQMLGVLRSRSAIDQAKGAVIGLLGCDADTAWTTLRRASQQFNVKVRDLAIALIEYLGHSPAEQPAEGSPIRPDAAARRAAELTWRALSQPATPADNSGHSNHVTK